MTKTTTAAAKRRVKRWPAGTPHPVDQHVGARVRERRVLLGLSQTMLGKAVGLTFQQIQKYERGGNRISASMLYRFAKFLDVDVGWFFADMPRVALDLPGKMIASAENPLAKREVLELARAFVRLGDAKARKRVAALVKTLAAAAAAPAKRRAA